MVEVLKRSAVVRFSDSGVGIPGPGTMDGYVCCASSIGAAAPSMIQVLRRMMKRGLVLNIVLLGGHLGTRS